MKLFGPLAEPATAGIALSRKLGEPWASAAPDKETGQCWHVIPNGIPGNLISKGNKPFLGPNM